VTSWPPYDVIDRDLQTTLYQRHPANVIRLILNRPEPGDENARPLYAAGGPVPEELGGEGVLQHDRGPGDLRLPSVGLSMTAARTRRGFMAAVRLERFGEGNDLSARRDARGRQGRSTEVDQACRANLSQVFGLYPDPDSGTPFRSCLEAPSDRRRWRRPTTWASSIGCGRSPT
jgi:hypothetical protein